ncbi:MAG: D-2-hydroxyacid dehydrogenase [Chloroflexi bacterium]|nr:D-2-hydroxyacid dehydrogenase [Chloroflexota bacterium]
MTDSDPEVIRVVVTVNLGDELLEQLREVSPRLHIERHFPNVPETVWHDADILYTQNRFPQPEQAPRLRWIQLHFAGIDHTLKEPIIQSEDVEVTTASGVHSTHMAEFCLGMMLAFMYKIPLLVELKARSEWPENRYQLFAPHGLRGLTLGIFGYGSIGRELARMADALGMRVLVSKRDVKHPADTGYQDEGLGDPTGDIPARIYPPQALASMASECDFLALLAPLTKDTRHIVNEQVLKSMKKTAVLINAARGGLVDEAALISALASETIAGAALDVFEEEPLPKSSPLWNLDHVIISPHASGNNAFYNQRAAQIFAENLRRYLGKEPLLNRIDREKGY